MKRKTKLIPSAAYRTKRPNDKFKTKRPVIYTYISIFAM